MVCHAIVNANATCSKPSYQIVFWLIVVLFQLASVDLILGHSLSRVLIDFVMVILQEFVAEFL